MLDITPTHLFVRGDHLPEPDYKRAAEVADTLERALNSVQEAAEEARRDPTLSPDGVREKREHAATEALALVEKAAEMAEVFEKESQSHDLNRFVATQLKGVDPSEAAAQRRHRLDLFLDQLRAQPEDKRGAWARAQLMDAATNDRKVLLGAVYEAVEDLGGAYGLEPELLDEVHEAHFQTVDPDGMTARDRKAAAAQLVQANKAKAVKALREMGAGATAAEPAGI